MGRFLNLCTIALLCNLILAPQCHILGKKFTPLKNCSIELLYIFQKNLTHNILSLNVPVSYLLSSVSCLLYHVSCLTSHVSCLMSHVSCLLSHVSCLASPVSCLLSHISCLMSPVSQVLSLISLLLSPVSCLNIFNKNVNN